MSQVLHLLKKDLWAMRWPLGLMYALIAVHTLTALRDPLVHPILQELYTIALWIMLAVLGVTGMLIQQEPLVGTTAFWMTRPVSRMSLLASKVVFALTFIVAPWVLTVASIVTAYGIDRTRILTVVGIETALMITLMVCAALTASVTPNLAAFAATWVLYLVGGQVLTLSFAGVLGDRSHMEGAPWFWTQLAVALLVGGGLILYQYLTRRTLRTAIGICIAFIGYQALDRTFSWTSQPQPVTSVPKDRIEIALRSGAPGGFFVVDRKSEQTTTIKGDMAFVKVPPGVNVSIGTVFSTLRDAGGRLVEFSSGGSEFDTGAIEAALPGFRWLDEKKSQPMVLSLKSGQESLFDTFVDKPAEYRANVTGAVFRYRVVGSIPLTVGSKFERSGYTLLVRDIEPRMAVVRVSMRIRHVEVGEQRPFSRIMLLNRERMEMAEGDKRDVNYNSYTVGLFSHGRISAFDESAYFPVGPIQQNPDGRSARGFELAFLEPAEGEHFETEVVVKNLRVLDSTALSRLGDRLPAGR